MRVLTVLRKRRRWLREARANGVYDRFVDRTDDVMLVIAVIFVGILVWPLLDRGLSPGIRAALHWADVTIWVIFAAEYLTRFVLAPQRWRFVRSNLPDLVVVIVPPLRSLRVVAALFRLLGLVSMVGRLSRQSLEVRTGSYTAILAIGVLFAGAVTVYAAERDNPDANIKTFPDALWWAMTTMTTVGYGDRYPVTTEGRIMAGVLMLAGIAILGIVTASIAAWFIGQFSQVSEQVSEDLEGVSEGLADERAEVLAVVRSLADRMEALESRLADLNRTLDASRHAEEGGTGTEPARMRDDHST